MRACADFIMNGVGQGDIGQTLMSHGFDVNAMRPWIGDDGRTYIAQPKYKHIMENGRYFSLPETNETGLVVYQAIPVANATATLRKDEWKLLDEAIMEVAKERTIVQADLRAKGLVFTIPNGMGTTVFQTETVSDINEAEIDMDGLSDPRNDRPVYELTNLPLPIIHKEFSYSARQIATSRLMGPSVDTTSAKLAARRVVEGVEKLLLGIAQTYIGASFAFGGGTVYGYSNYPSRLTKTFTAPTASGWTPATLVNELLAAREQLTAQNYYGPYMIYTGASWDQYLDRDYDATTPGTTLRERVLKIPTFSGMNRVDYLTGYNLFMVQMTEDVVRTVIGMDMTVLQWPEKAGLKQNFKVMTIQVPQLRADQLSQTGIMHGSTA